MSLLVLILQEVKLITPSFIYKERVDKSFYANTNKSIKIMFDRLNELSFIYCHGPMTHFLNLPSKWSLMH